MIDATIPLRSFAVQTTDPMEMYTRLAQLRALGNDEQMRRMQMEQYQMNMDELRRKRDQEQAIRDAGRGAIRTVTPSVPFEMTLGRGNAAQTFTTPVQGVQRVEVDRPQLLARLTEIDPATAMQYQQHFDQSDLAQRKAELENQKLFQQMTNDQLAQVQKMTDGVRGDLARLKAVDPKYRASAWPVVRQQALQKYPQMAGQVPEQYPGDQWLDATAADTEVFKTVLENEAKARTAKNQEAQNAETARHNQQSEWLTQRGQNMVDARTREQNQIARDTKQLLQNQQTQDALQSFDETIAAAQELKTHPGLSTSVGVKGVTGALPTWMTPGTDATNFKAKLETFQSKLFLPMVQKLRGMGQLSDAEGRKLTAAAGALNRDMSEKEFVGEVDKIITSLQNARNRKAGSMGPVQTNNNVAAPDPLGIF